MGVYIKGMTKQQALQWLHYQMPFIFQVSDDDIIEVEEPQRMIDGFEEERCPKSTQTYGLK